MKDQVVLQQWISVPLMSSSTASILACGRSYTILFISFRTPHLFLLVTVCLFTAVFGICMREPYSQRPLGGNRRKTGARAEKGMVDQLILEIQ